jgi:hypothetical protein
VKTGGCVRDHLEQVWQQTGVMPPELVGHELPDAIQHVWNWFLKLNGRRGIGFNAPNPITYQDILAWSHLMQIEPTPFEVDCIVDLDAAWINPKEE